MKLVEIEISVTPEIIERAKVAKGSRSQICPIAMAINAATGRKFSVGIRTIREVDTESPEVFMSDEVFNYRLDADSVGPRLLPAKFKLSVPESWVNP